MLKTGTPFSSLKRLLYAFLFCLVITAIAVRGHAATPEEYAHTLTVLKNKIDANVDILYDKGYAPAIAPFARILFANPVIVQMPDGSAIFTDHQELIDQIVKADKIKDLNSRVDTYTTIVYTIQGLIDELKQYNTARDRHNTYQTKIRNILTQPQYDPEVVPMPSGFDRQMMKFEKWFENSLRKWFRPRGRNNIGSMSPPPQWLFYLLIGIVVAVFFALIVTIVMKLIGTREARIKDGGIVKRPEEALVEARDTDSLMAMAERYAHDGDYRSAFRLVYISTLIALDTGGVILFDRSKISGHRHK